MRIPAVPVLVGLAYGVALVVLGPIVLLAGGAAWLLGSDWQPFRSTPVDRGVTWQVRCAFLTGPLRRSDGRGYDWLCWRHVSYHRDPDGDAIGTSCWRQHESLVEEPPAA